MGLLDVFNSDEGRMALGLLAAAGPSSQPMSFGQRLAGAMSQHDAYLQHKQAAAAAEQDRQLKAQMIQAQIADMKAQEQQRIGQAQDIQRKAAEQARISGLVRNAFAPTQAIDANTASGVSGPRPEALGVVGQRPQVNYQDLIAQGVPPEYVQKLAESRNYGRDKVARTVDGKDEQGRPVTYQLDDFGVRQGTPIQQWKAPEKIDTGGQIGMMDPTTMQILKTFQKSQTPDGRASNSVAWARLAQDKAQAAQTAAAGQLVQDADGAYIRIGKDNRATPIMAPSGVQPLLGKGAGMTEDQGKATGWLVQAESAYKNMKSAMAANPGASMPGLNDVLAKVPMMGPVANSMRGEERQRFLQSSESFHEAVLRAATGAGVNKDEAAQKARELTPQLGDSQAVINQKMAAYPVYIESLKVRAGPGAKKAAGISSQQAPTSGGVKFLGFE